MDSNKWNTVLLEWVNCLKLGKSIRNISELRNGEFFTDLRKVIIKSRESNQDILNFIFDLMGRHYPAYKIENQSEIHLSDLPEIDLKAIVSLLMHYTCIFDRRDVLTSPLCHSLSQKTQLVLRNYFQRVNKSINAQSLNKIIEQCLDENTETLTNQWLCVNNSRGKNSPLMDLLKTPLAKVGKLQEKDKVIANLKSELEVERYEKADLQEELKLQQEKNVKIEHQLLQKNNEISRLRSEVVALENRTPPHYQDQDSREVQKRLKVEIQSLEQYIQQIESEQEDVRKEKDTLKEKLRSLETICTNWQEKFFELERNHEKLKERSSQRDEDLSNLQEHCSELTAMLEEYRSKSLNDSSMYDNSSTIAPNRTFESGPPYEDLAGSVVEVQLRDAQKLNEELSNQLKENHEISAHLKREIEDVNAKLRRSEQNVEEINNLNEKLNSKFESTLSECNMYKEKLAESEKALETLTEQSHSQQAEIIGFKDQLCELNSTLDSVRHQFENLQDKNEQTSNELEESKKQSNKLTNEVNSLENEVKALKDLSNSLQQEKSALTTQYDELCKKYKSCQNDLQETSQNLVITEMLLHANKQELETVKLEKSDLQAASTLTQKQMVDASKKIEILGHEIMNLQNRNEAAENELRQQIEKKTKKCKQLKESKKELELKLKDAELERKMLKAKTSKCQKLLVDLKQHLNSIKSEMQEIKRDSMNSFKLCFKQVEEFNVLYEKLKCENIKLMEEKSDLQKLNDRSHMEGKKRLKKLSSKLDVLERSIKRFQIVDAERAEEQNAIQREKDQLDENFSELKLKYNELQDELKLNKDKLADALQTTAELKDDLECLQKRHEELTDLKNATQSKVDSLSDENMKTKQEFEVITNDFKHENEKLGFLYEEQKSENIKLTEEKCELQNLYDTTRIQWKEKSEKQMELEESIKSKLEESERSCKKLEIELAEKTDEHSQRQNTNQSENTKLVEQFSELKLEYNQLQKELELNKDNLADALQTTAALTDDLKCLQKRYEELTDLKNATQFKVDSLSKENTKTTQEFERIKEDLKHESDKLEQEVAAKTILSEEMLELRKEIQSLEEKCQMLSSVNERAESKISNLELHLSKLTEDLIKKEKELTTIQSFKEELTVSEAKSIESLNILRKEKEKLKIESENIKSELHQQIENLTLNLNEINKKYESLQDENSKHVEEISTLYKSINGLAQELNSRNTDLDLTNTKLADSCEKNKELIDYKNQLEERIEKLENDLDDSQKQLLQVRNQLELAESSQKALTEEKSILELRQDKCFEQLEDYTNLNTELKSTLDSAREELKNVQESNFNEVVLLKNLISEKENTNAAVTQEKEALLLKIASLELQLETIQEQLSKTIDNLELATKRSEELKEDQGLLEIQLEEARKMAENYEKDIKNLKDEKNELNEKLSGNLKRFNNVEDEKDLWKVKYEELSKTNETSELELKQIKDINNNLQKQYEEAANKTKEYEQKIQQIQDECEITKNLLLNKDNALKQLENDKNILQESNEKFVKAEAQLLLQIHFLEDEKESVQKQSSEISNNLELCRQLADESKNKNGLLEKELMEANNESQKCRAEIESTNKLLEETKATLESIQKEKDTIVVQLNEITEKCASLNKDKESLLLKVNDLESGKLDVAEELNAKIALHQEQIVKLEEEKSAQEKKTEIYEIMAGETQDKIKLLEETVQDYEITISGLKNVIEKNLETVNQLREEQKDAENQFENVQSDLVKITSERNEILEFLKQVLTPKFANLAEHNNKDAILEHFKRALDEQAESNLDLKKQVEDLKSIPQINTTLLEIIEKFQMLVFEKSTEVNSLEALEPLLKSIYEKLEPALKTKEKLGEDLEKLSIEKLDVMKQLEAKNLTCEELLHEKKELEIVRTNLTREIEAEKSQVSNLSKQIELLLKVKTEKIEKENILTNSAKPNLGKSPEELKKENMLLKKKLVLTENSKNNLEKVLKDLRQKTKTSTDETSDAQYKQLLQDYIKMKADHEEISKGYEELVKQCEQFKNKKPIKEEEKKIEQDLLHIREAYSNIVSANSKLELENVTLRKVIEEKNTDIANFQHIKEAYEKLLEENNKWMTEVDTVKYKRMRDKEEFVRLLKKERDDAQAHESRKVHEVRSEYESKLEKMKDKMLRLYREEVNKEVQKIKEGQNENTSLSRTIGNLKSELFEAEQRIQLLEMERDMLKSKMASEMDMYRSRDSLRHHDPSMSDRNSIISRSSRDSVMSGTANQKQMYSRLTTITRDMGRVEEQRRVSTLPRQAAFMEEITISRRTSIGSVPANIGQNLHMEDEEDLFNDKYLTDLKEGRCALPLNGKESTSTRFSELAWRNSMVPPHLKSSYPAETQFVSPARFKEDDIKGGHVEFEDSLCKLLPGEKPRKKDFGTTSYKKPGPPTPSKNGGRPSLQGNEIHPMREHCEAKTPKRSTPNRIKALFTSRNSISHSESQSSSTPNRTGRRLNIFRKQK